MPKLSFFKLWKYGVFSGILIGLICLIPVIGGWDIYIQQHKANPNYKLGPLTRLMSSLFFWVTQGVLMCWLLSKFAFSDKERNNKYKKGIIFFTGSLFTAIAIQLAARDALIFNSKLMEAGEGGPLGEPSFETIGNFFAAGCIYLGIYTLFINSNKFISFFKTNYLSTLTLASMSYGAVFLIYYSITGGNKILGNWGIKEYIFEWSFPHPVRIFLLPLMISILFIVYYFGIKYETKKMSKREFDIAISYSSKDVLFANKLRDKLEANNIVVYKDDKYIHESLGRILLDYLSDIFLNRTKYVLIIVSQNYVTSLYGSAELSFIKDKWIKNKEIILPIILDTTKLSELGLPNGLGYLDAQKYPVKEIAQIITLKIRPVDPK